MTAGAPAIGPTPRMATAAPPAGAALVERGTIRHDEVRVRRWEVRGIAKVVRQVEVGVGSLAGTVVIGGALTAEELQVVGSLEARGPVQVAGRFVARGSVDVRSTTHAGEAELAGPIRCAGELGVDRTLRVRGALQAPSLRGGGLEIRGSATIPGNVVAESFDAHLVGDSAIGSVQCRTFRLRGPVPGLVPRLLGPEAVVTVERVDAERAWVEGARVGLVRAGEITLGRAARVTAIEGKLVRAHPSSRVGPSSWSRPPPGLSR